MRELKTGQGETGHTAMDMYGLALLYLDFQKKACSLSYRPKSLRLRPFLGNPVFLNNIRSSPRKRSLRFVSVREKGSGLSGWLI